VIPSSAVSATSLDVTAATPDALDVVLDILRSAGRSRPAPPTGGWGHEFPDVVRDIPAGQVYLGCLAGEPVGTFVLRWSDEPVWGPDDGAAGYLHRLAIRPAVAGQGIGARLISEAGQRARRYGRPWLRLDCDRDNPRLRAYYEALGFSYAGDVTGLARKTLPGYRDASRYQRSTGLR
jgi:GNAT superfamily N-acetyltransferase